MGSILMVGRGLLDLRVANTLPALFFAPLLVAAVPRRSF
jgi:uncharacterized membrane protein YqgA involved in biofilm formation